MFELTHGLAYLVFKNQIYFISSPRFRLGRNYWLYRINLFCQPLSETFSTFSLSKFLTSETSDYTELNFFVNRSMLLFNFSLFTVEKFHERNFWLYRMKSLCQLPSRIFLTFSFLVNKFSLEANMYSLYLTPSCQAAFRYFSKLFNTYIKVPYKPAIFL